MLPLEGLLVVAIEQAVAAPFCTARLAAAGARVIKIERKEGDFARAYDQAAKGESSYFTWLNQGKESVTLDFKQPSDAAVLHAILKQADVLVQNLSPGALARAGFSTEQLQQQNPGLIVCNISGYGATGEVANKRAYDLLVQAESGLIAVSSAAESPSRIGISICDIGTGMTAYSGVLEALLKRASSALADEISISLFDVSADWMAVPYTHAHYGRGTPEAGGLRHPSVAPYGAFACSDDRLVLISVQNEREWERLCLAVLQAPKIFENGLYGSNNLRVANRDKLEADITAITRNMLSDEFQKRLQTAQIAYGAINGPLDLKQHAAMRLDDYRTSTNHILKLAAHPVRWQDTSPAPPRKSPALGEHNEAIRREFSGTAS